jgi:hypothetical protein
LVRESFPQARQLGLLWDASSRDQVEAATTTAKSLDFEPRPIEVTGEPPDYAAAFGQMADVPGEPVVIPAGPIFLRDRTTIARLLLERRIPSIAAFREIVESGAVRALGNRSSAPWLPGAGGKPRPTELDMRWVGTLGQWQCAAMWWQEESSSKFPFGLARA